MRTREDTTCKSPTPPGIWPDELLASQSIMTMDLYQKSETTHLQRLLPARSAYPRKALARTRHPFSVHVRNRPQRIHEKQDNRPRHDGCTTSCGSERDRPQACRQDTEPVRALPDWRAIRWSPDVGPQNPRIRAQSLHTAARTRSAGDDRRQSTAHRRLGRRTVA